MASAEEARLAVHRGADALGLVSAMPSGPGPIEESLIAEIRRAIPPPVASFLLTCRQDAASVIDQLRRTGCNTVQLCDELTGGEYAEIRSSLPGISIVQVVHVSGEASVEAALEAAERGADALLLDSGRPSAVVKELGGTGRVHDWSISRRIVDAVERPVFLAGGLTPSNVAEAIRQVDPFGVDVCSGVRTDGRLDESKLVAFMLAVGEAARG